MNKAPESAQHSHGHEPVTADNSFPDNDLAKIQKILFGAQMLEHASQLRSLEARMNSRLDEMAQSLDARITAIASTVQEHRQLGLHTETALREQLQNSASTLQTSIETTGRMLNEQLSQSVETLQYRKLDREQMATMLTSLASQLTAVERVSAEG